MSQLQLFPGISTSAREACPSDPGSSPLSGTQSFQGPCHSQEVQPRAQWSPWPNPQTSPGHKPNRSSPERSVCALRTPTVRGGEMKKGPERGWVPSQPGRVFRGTPADHSRACPASRSNIADIYSLSSKPKGFEPSSPSKKTFPSYALIHTVLEKVKSFF